jgi:hypothetical protein
MRQKLGIFIGLILLVLVLIGLNAATYVQREKTPDSEVAPNRSSFNSGATGTQAFYSLLSETGRKVMRWQSPIDALLAEKRNRPTTFVIVGQTRKPFDEIETKQILDWVNDGGRLVLIDRQPPEKILEALKDWNVKVKTNDLELMFGMDPSDQKQMTTEMPASKPIQPSVFTTNVNAVQTSRFASDMEFSWNPRPKGLGTGTERGNIRLQNSDSTYDFYQGTPTPVPELNLPPPPAKHPSKSPEKFTVKGDRDTINGRQTSADDDNGTSYDAPVVHLSGGGRNILIDAQHGLGSIVILTDPYVVSNVGVSLVDNAQLGTNVVTAVGGLIAFDEYHQGYGSSQNRVFQYFAGTPVVAIFAQLAVIAAFVFFSQSRRFARPVPEPEPNRLTKLEYVSAMAELQQRTRAFDLAIENIYTDFRRRVSRLFGVDNMTTGRKQLAALIAERIKSDALDIEDLMFKCEDVIHGEPTNKKESVAIAARLREIETQLGLVRQGKTKAM